MSVPAWMSLGRHCLGSAHLLYIEGVKCKSDTLSNSEVFSVVTSPCEWFKDFRHGIMHVCVVQQCEPSKGSQCVKSCTCLVEVGTAGFPTPSLGASVPSLLQRPPPPLLVAWGLLTWNSGSSSEENLFSMVGFFNLSVIQSEAFFTHFLVLGTF